MHRTHHLPRLSLPLKVAALLALLFLALLAFQSPRTASANVGPTIGTNSCTVSGACDGLASTTVIGDNSCNAEDACDGLVGTVGNDSCNAYYACAYGGGNGGILVIGDHSCNASESCDHAADESDFVVGNYSCNASWECEYWQGGRRIANCSKNGETLPAGCTVGEGPYVNADGWSVDKYDVKATLVGNVYLRGFTGTTAICLYGTDSTMRTGTTTVTANESPVAVDPENDSVGITCNATGLTNNTKYYFQVEVTTVVGTARSDIQDFTTEAKPHASMVEPTSVGQTTATFTGTVNAVNLSTTVKFQYSTTSNFSSNVTDLTPAQSPVTGSADTTVTYNLTGLATGTNYYVRLVATNSAGTTTTSKWSFRTDGPKVITVAADSLTKTSARLNGTVNARSTSTAITFVWGTDSTLTTGTTTVTVSGSPFTDGYDNDVSIRLNSLTTGTTYYYRVVATSTLGTFYGAILSFVAAGATVDPTSCTGDGYCDNLDPSTVIGPGSCLASGACQNLKGTVGAGSCTTANSCRDAGLSGTVSIGAGSCIASGSGNDLYVCQNAGKYGSATIGAGSCLGQSTCRYLGQGGTVTIGAGSCIGNTACGNLGRDTATASVGAGSCTGTEACSRTAWGFSRTFIAGNHACNGILVCYGLTTATYANDTQNTVLTVAATSVGSSGATLNGTANPVSRSSTITFVYGTNATLSSGTTTVTASQSPIAGNSTDTAVSYALTGLSPGTTYYYKVVITNIDGTAWGVIMSFTTSGSAPAVPTVLLTAYNAFSNSGRCSAELNRLVAQVRNYLRMGSITQSEANAVFALADAACPPSSPTRGGSRAR